LLLLKTSLLGSININWLLRPSSALKKKEEEEEAAAA